MADVRQACVALICLASQKLLGAGQWDHALISVGCCNVYHLQAVWGPHHMADCVGRLVGALEVALQAAF